MVNDEGKINGMEPNRWCGEDIICGPFFICGDNRKGDFISLTDEQIERYTEMFGEIPQFSGEEPELEPYLTFIAFRCNGCRGGLFHPRGRPCADLCPFL